MDTKQQLELLYEICLKDLELVKSRAELARLSKQSSEAKESAAELHSQISLLSEKKTEALKKRKLLDEKLQTEKSNLRKWEQRAEKIKGEREYAALMSEISAQKRAIIGIEAEISEVNDEIKQCENKLLKATGEHEEKIESSKQAYESVKEILAREQENLDEHENQKNTLLDKLEKPLRRRYERIYAQRSQSAIAFLHNEVCQGCMRTIPPELFIRVLKGEIIEQCPSCQRILVADVARGDKDKNE